ncbi:extracellular solute-binding protein (plasmid) [Sinorhizobium meliloti]|nr:extracellular solute-binding protein [Sinorhizobium meliloti]
MIQNNEIDFSYTYNGRVEKAREAGIDVEFSKDQALILTEYLAVLKGSPRVENAMRFLAFHLDAERQAEFSNAYKAIPVIKAAFPVDHPEVMKRLPDVNDPRTSL